MKIVIDISDEGYDWIKNGFPDDEDKEFLIKAVKNGTVIPPTVKSEKAKVGELIDAYTKGFDNGVEIARGDWIPVSERLPIRNGVYNVTRKLKEGETIYFISDASYFDGQNTWHSDICVNHGRPYLTDIIAWQPLPEPYKKGGAE